MSKLLFC